MKVSYNWLKWYIPDAPEAKKLADVITYHLAEVESVTPLTPGEGAGGGDFILDIKILPNRAHDLLSHQGVARELASLLDIKYIDPTPKYKIPDSKPTKLQIEIKSPKCRRHVGRVVRNIKVGPAPDWVKQHLESIGQRSINNIVDATNIVMFDCGQPAHAFDMDKVKGLKLVIRQAFNGEKITPLGGKEKILNETMLVIADGVGNPLDVAGIKGGTNAELDAKTTNIILESDNFEPISTRKTAQALNIFTEARKRFENDLSSELAPYAMRELSALIAEMCPEAIFEDIVDVYPEKQPERKLSFSVEKLSKILGLEVSGKEIESILKRYVFEYVFFGDKFEITVPPMRLDLVTEEDMAEEIGRILGYDKVKPNIPKITFTPKVNETYAKIKVARNKLLDEGYSEVMTYSFCDKGEIEVEKSAMDKNFLRTNLADGLKESLKLNNLNAPLLGLDEIKIFEIGTVFKKSGEEMHVVYNEGNKIIEKKLEEFQTSPPTPLLAKERGTGRGAFTMWSLYPFISRDIAVWAGEGDAEKIKKILLENATELSVREPLMFDSFTKDGKTSYAFRLVFQSYDRTLTDGEVNQIMDKITNKIKDNQAWQVR